MFRAQSGTAWAVLPIAALAFSVAAAQEAPTTPVGRWLAEDIGGGGVADRVQTTLDLAADGSVSGSGGCNRYSGRAEIDGSSIAFRPLAATRMMCPPSVMDQEETFFAALETVRFWRIEGTKLVLVDGSGDGVVRFAAVPSAATITIEVPAAEAVLREKAAYVCGDVAVEVEYINAGQVSLATLSMQGEFVVAANVLAASGARYAGDRFVWWSKGDSADLYDLTMGEDSAPVSCRKAE